VFGVQSRARRTVCGTAEQQGRGATDSECDAVGESVGSVEAVSVDAAVGAGVTAGVGEAVGAAGVVDGPDAPPHAPTTTAITLTAAIQRQPLSTSLAP
jgi:hypothetical protein